MSVLSWSVVNLYFCASPQSVAGQKLGASAHWSWTKNMETEFGGSRKLALILSRQRAEHSSLMPQKLCLRSMRSPGAYIRWGTKVTGSWFLPHALFQRQSQAGISNSVIEAGSWVALWPSFWCVTIREGCYKQIGAVLSVESKEKNVNCSSCRFRGKKIKLSYRPAELWAVKVKKKTKTKTKQKQTKNVQACSLISLSLLFSKSERINK